MSWGLALLFAVLAVALLWIARQKQRDSGLPAGRVIYSDHKSLGQPEKPFFDADAMLTGRPDYLVEVDGVAVPVEVKSSFAPPEPYEGHVYQLMAYCLLVEQSTGVRPPYGILRYRNRSFALDYTSEAERDLRDLLEEMHTAGRRHGLERSHADRNRCARCGYRSSCDQRLN